MARKILLADDSVTAQNMGRKILVDAGYDVVTVNNGSAALKRINDINPDLIVLDVYMPGYSGLEVCQRLKESADTAHIPVLLTVGKLEPFKPEEARRVRADAHIVKPFEASELLTAITKLEDRMVPQHSEGSRFSSTTAGVERFNGEASGRKSAKVPETDTGWKNRIRFPSKKKKEEEPDPEDVAAAAGATFQDSKKGKKAAGNGAYGKASSEKEPAVVPEIPRDITPEELDALSALAEKLDAPQQEIEKSAAAPAIAEKTQPEATAPELVTPKSEPAPVVVEAPREPESPPAATMAAMPVESAPALPEEVAPAVEVQNNIQERPAETSPNETARAEAVVAVATSPLPEPEPSSAQTGVDLAASVADAAGRDEQASPLPLTNEPPSPNPVAPFDVVNAQVVNDEVAIASTTEAAAYQPEQAPVIAPVENSAPEAPQVAGAQVEAPRIEDPAPSDDELAAALELLTPATGNTESSPSNEDGLASHPSEHLDEVAPSGPRWVAETVALSAEESSLSLEAEMLGSFAGPTARPTAIAAPTTSTELSATSTNAAVAESGMERGIGFSGIAAAVETRLAEAGLGASTSTWASERQRAAENAAAEVASALEASAELLAAASAATPVTTQASQAVDDIERQMASERSDADRSESRRDAVEGNSAQENFEQGNSATFADAMSSSSDKNEIESIAGQNGESQEPEHVATTEVIHDSIEVEGQNSMSKNGRTKSGKSNGHELETASQPSAEVDLVEPHRQSAPVSEDAQKAMAAAASEGSSTSTDASTIASIVDSVMADLRPRIVEEIARKLAKK